MSGDALEWQVERVLARIFGRPAGRARHRDGVVPPAGAEHRLRLGPHRLRRAGRGAGDPPRVRGAASRHDRLAAVHRPRRGSCRASGAVPPAAECLLAARGPSRRPGPAGPAASRPDTSRCRSPRGRLHRPLDGVVLLERAPGIDVVLLERDVCGSGASGRNGGFIGPWWDSVDSLAARYGDEAALAACRASEQSVAAIGDGVRPRGWTPGTALRRTCWWRRRRLGRGMGQAVEAARRMGRPEAYRELSAAEVRAVCDSPALRGGAAMDGATVQPARLARGLAGSSWSEASGSTRAPRRPGCGPRPGSRWRRRRARSGRDGRSWGSTLGPRAGPASVATWSSEEATCWSRPPPRSGWSSSDGPAASRSATSAPLSTTSGPRPTDGSPSAAWAGPTAGGRPRIRLRRGLPAVGPRRVSPHLPSWRAVPSRRGGAVPWRSRPRRIRGSGRSGPAPSTAPSGTRPRPGPVPPWGPGPLRPGPRGRGRGHAPAHGGREPEAVPARAVHLDRHPPGAAGHPPQGPAGGRGEASRLADSFAGFAAAEARLQPWRLARPVAEAGVAPDDGGLQALLGADRLNSARSGTSAASITASMSTLARSASQAPRAQVRLMARFVSEMATGSRTAMARASRSVSSSSSSGTTLLTRPWRRPSSAGCGPRR